MRTITQKAEVQVELAHCLEALAKPGLEACIAAVDQRLLQAKVKFPLLEFCAKKLCEALPSDARLAFCEGIARLNTEGGNVLLGIFLQQRLEGHFEESMLQAADFIARGDAWYVCDIIGERVFGFALLKRPADALRLFGQLSRHPSAWVVRALGAGAHYAIKKGLPEAEVRPLFALLLSLADAKDFHVRQGIGWAAKTTAKFHPAVIQASQKEIADPRKTGNWFRAKVQIGLARNAHAQGNHG